MKRLLFYVSIHLSLWAAAQPYEIPEVDLASDKATNKVIKLDVCYSKTTHIVFPSAIVSIDRGSGNILVEKADGVENVLKVKAGTKGFDETSLAVITSGNKLY